MCGQSVEGWVVVTAVLALVVFIMLVWVSLGAYLKHCANGGGS